MKKFTNLLLASLFVISLSAQTRSLSNFNEIGVSGSITATLVKSNETKIDIKMIKGDEESLITEVEDGKLTVKFKKGLMNWNNNKKAEVTIYYKNLDEIDASAGCSVSSEEVVSGNSLDLDVSSGASVRLEVEGEMVDVDASSGATVTVKGSSERADIDASSGASVNAQYLEANHTSADVSSGASISCVAHKSIEAEASSGGSIKYKGDPAQKNIDVGKYSGGSVSRM